MTMRIAVADAGDAAAMETRRARLFRALTQNSGPLSTSDLVGLLTESVPRQRLLVRYGQILRREEHAGRVERTGRAPGSRGRPAVVWDITDAGRAWLDEYDKAPARAALAAAAAEREAGGTHRTAAERDRALDEASASFSGQTSRLERKRAAQRLRDFGCTLDEIGLVFAVSRERIRQDLLWDPAAPPVPRKRPAKPQRRPLSPPQEALMLGMYSCGPEKDYPLNTPTFRVLKERGLSRSAPGPAASGGTS